MKSLSCASGTIIEMDQKPKVISIASHSKEIAAAFSGVVPLNVLRSAAGTFEDSAYIHERSLLSA
jgi:hypothetical protein